MTQIDEILKNRNAPKLLFDYYLQDAERVLINYYAYSKYLSYQDKLKLVYSFLKNANLLAVDEILTDILTKYYDKYPKEIDELLKYLLKLDKEKKIDVDNFIIKNNIYQLDPWYAVKKNIHNIRNLYYINNYQLLYTILEYLNEKKYHFSLLDKRLIGEEIVKNQDILIYFINNSYYNDDVIAIITAYFDKLDKQTLYNIYQKINNDNIKDFIVGTVNFDNFDINTVIDNYNIYLMTDHQHDKTLSFLKIAKERHFMSNIILIMERVDLSFVKKAERIYGNKIKVSPIANQECKVAFTGPWNMPYYSVSKIIKSEQTFDLYTKTVIDYKDQDGDIKSLSPLEKFIAAYIMTIKFAPYKEEKNKEKSYVSRSVYEFIAKGTNKRIVCVGYVHLLKEFLMRMGIKDTIDWFVMVPSDTLENEGHLRMMIHLVDYKYHIDGIYMSDPTWDEKGLMKTSIHHMLMSYDELEKVDRNISIDDLFADEYEKMEEELDVTNAYELFRKPIAKDTIIKACLALNHFLDLEMKMVKNDEYSEQEYQEMANKLGIKSF